MAEIRLDAGALAGFLAHDPLLGDATLQPNTGGTTESSYTLGSPQPGRATFKPSLTGASATLGTRSPDLRLVTSGRQKGDQRVMVSRAGMPGSDLGVVVADTSGASPVWYGWSQPHVLESATAGALDAGLDAPHNVGACETADGYALFVYADNNDVVARRWDASASAWAASAAPVLTSAAAADDDDATWQLSVGGVIDVIRLSSGRCLAATLGIIAGERVIATAWSDDHGLTWRSASLAAGDIPYAPAVSTSITSLRLGYDAVHDAVLLLLTITYTEQEEGDRSGWVQYASADAGAAFELVEAWDDGDSGAVDAHRPAIVADPITGTLAVLEVAPTGVGVAEIRQRRIATPYAPLRAAAVEVVASLASGVALPEDVAAWADRTGTLWAAWSPVGTRAEVARSLDGGATWATLSTPLYDGTAGGLDRLTPCPVGVEVVWAAMDTSASARPAQVRAIWQSGGWRTLCQPRVDGAHPHELRGWAATWAAYTTPAGVGWSNSGAPGTVAGIGDWRLDLAATPSTWGYGLGHAASDGIIVDVEVSAVAGSSLTALDQGVRVRLGTADIALRLSASAARFYDSAGAAQIGSDLSLSLGSRHHLRLALRDVGGTYYAAAYARPAGDPLWRLIAAGTVATSSAAADSVTFGIFAGSGTMSSSWHRVSFTKASGNGAPAALTDDPSFGTLLSAAPYTLPAATVPGLASRLPLLDGLMLSATAGPGLRGETWDIPVADTYGAEHVLSRSPSQPWRSEDDSSAQIFAWEPSGGEVHHPGGRAVGLAIFGANFRTAHLELYAGGAWVTAATLDLGSGLTSLPYTRTGDTIRVAAGGATTTLQALDLIGATVDLGSGYLRRVGSATGGTWTSGSATATLRLDSITGAEPTSGSLDLWLTTGAAVRLGAVTAGTHWRLRIPAQDTVDGYLTVGRAVLGPVGVMIRYSRGRAIATRPEVVTSESPGRRTARRLAPPVRTVSLAWVEGVPTRRHLTAPAHLAGGGLPLVGAGDLGAIDALQHTHGGGLEPLVYLPRIAATPGAVSAETVLCLGRDLAIYGAPIGELSVENVEGDEVAREVVRVAGLTIGEEV